MIDKKGDARARLGAALERVAQGDRDALRRVYDLTSAKLHGICLHILADRELAEDVLQEVYLKVWQTAGAFDPTRSSPITWLCMIARNRAIDWRRSAGRYVEAVRETAEIQPTGSSWNGEAEDRRHLLYRCIDELEAESSIAIRAAFIEGYTYAELAIRAGVPLGTMKGWIRLSIGQLRKCVDHG